MTPRWRVPLGAAAALATLTALVAAADARPGGGDSYSGGGGFGGGDSGGDGDITVVIELVFHLVRLCIEAPAIGLPLTAVVIGFFVYQAYQKRQNADWDSGPPVALQRQPLTLAGLAHADPDFSEVLFCDFANRLYATCHEARHDDAALAALAPYVSAAARDQLAARTPRGEVTGVVVGAMRACAVDLPDADAPDARSRVTLEFEANYTVTTDAGARTYYVVERWTLSRAATARTRPRDHARGFPCPNCGAPWDASRTHAGQACASCGEVVDNGRFDWVVDGIFVPHAREQPPTLTREVKERGTDLPTIHHSASDATWTALLAEDPALTEEALLARLRLIYDETYAAWARTDLAPARPYLSDGQFDYLAYWMDAYRAQGLVNHLEGMRVTHAVIVKVVRDRWYDAVTLRVWATGRDWVTTKDGQHVRGNRSKDRAYSEYWTLIRSAARRGPARVEKVCGNCGAPAKVGMTGACEFCGAHVTAGEFDWVLSRIEQDDSYRG